MRPYGYIPSMANNIIIFIIIVVVSYTGLCDTVNTSQDDIHVTAVVRIDPSDLVDSRGRHHDCPPRVRATVGLSTGDVVLNLELSTNSDHHNVPVIIATGANSTERWRQPLSFSVSSPCLYHDLSNTAAVSLQRERDFPKMRGVFHSRDYSYRISPPPNSLLRRKRSLRRRHYQEVHTVHRVKNPESYLKESYSRGRWKRQVSRNNYQVAFLVIVDLALYKRWYSLTSGVPSSVRKDATLRNIKYYFSHVVNEIDLRYKSIESKSFSMSVKLSGFYIATVASAAPWVETIKITGSTPALVDTDTVVDKLGDWVAANESYRMYDHVTLFTGYDLFGDLPNGQRDSTKIGSAFLAGICGPRTRVSVVEDRGHFKSALTTAHELGHSLNARHDGDRNDCLSSDQNIMASTVETRSDENIFRFSSCSINAFATHLSRLKFFGRNCLLNQAPLHNQTAMNKYLEELPGQKYTIREQCRLVYGKDSHYCGGQSDVDRICASLVCYNPTDGHCYVLGLTPAFPGTTCGNKTWCDKGQCVANTAAPEADETCTFGDFDGEVKVGEQMLNCSRILAKYPWLCYQADLRDLCCASCRSLHKPEQSGCEYGDRAQWCSQLSRSNCPANDQTCCRTCRQYQTDIPGCRYGDLHPRCPLIRRQQCYELGKETCCLTCHQWQTNLTDCQYGDSGSDCSTHVQNARDCYSRTTQERCCRTCHSHETNITECPYGDRISSCDTSRCIEEYYSLRCCGTCNNYKPTPTLSPTTIPTPTTLPTSLAPRLTTLSKTTKSTSLAPQTTPTRPTITVSNQPRTTRRPATRRTQPTLTVIPATTPTTKITTTTTASSTLNFSVKTIRPTFKPRTEQNIPVNDIGSSVPTTASTTGRPPRQINSGSPTMFTNQRYSIAFCILIVFMNTGRLFFMPIIRYL